jgi:hypothetical protein
LPSAVFGPVERVQGCQIFIFVACRARRSGVQPFLCFLVAAAVIFDDPLLCLPDLNAQRLSAHARAETRFGGLCCGRVFEGGSGVMAFIET